MDKIQRTTLLEKIPAKERKVLDKLRDPATRDQVEGEPLLKSALYKHGLIRFNLDGAPRITVLGSELLERAIKPAVDRIKGKGKR